MLENFKELYIDDEVWEDLFYHITPEFMNVFKKDVDEYVSTFHRLGFDPSEHDPYFELSDPNNFFMIRDKSGDGVGFYHAELDKMYLTQ